VAKYRKSFTNPHLYRQFSNNSSEMFDYTMTNIMDGFYDGAMNSAVDGKFKAVCLSGITSEINTGEGTGGNDAVIAGPFINLIVRPLSNFGNIIPDPRKSTDPNEINALISLHASTFMARSDDGFDVTRGIDFGEVIDCYFEKGSISNSDFRTLRFSQPAGKIIETSFQALAFIAGVSSLANSEWSGASMLGPAPNYALLGAEHLGIAEASKKIQWGDPATSEEARLRKAAFDALRPYLPKGVYITSGFRSQAKQEAIIKDYATRAKYGYTGDTNNYDEMWKFVRQKPNPGIVINRRVGRGHGGVGRTGAFDLAGVNLDLIWQSVEAANKALEGKVRFSSLKEPRGNSSIIERKNGCVHIAFFLDDIKI